MTGQLIILVLATVAAWLAHSWWWPHQRCPHCMGRQGRGIGSRARAYNRCHWCGGRGERIRLGARLIARATHRPVRGTKKG